MLDDDAKKIMYSKFDKDTNFQNIIKNVNQKKRKKIYIRFFQYALVPSCTILIICVLMLKNNNVANLLVGKRNTTLLNTMVKDNSIMDIEMNKMIENLENKIPTEISDKKEIYRTINSGEAIMSDDPTIPDNLINNHSKSNYVVKVKIISIGEGEMLPKQENFYNPHTCYTPIKIQITDNLMDTNKLSGIINAYINGGKIKISNLLKTINNEEARNLGVLNLSKEEREKYIEYIWTTPYFEPAIGDEYVMIIHKTNSDLYQIMCGGYGIFSVNKSNNQEKYINVITGKEWKIQ